ncbi:unnamed protein product [Mytilus edulis]|uniref:Uncharacterized protein n=1 Tax=Mytilus edulis TaxID=6550 RepID=A0A8S3TL49_MYTED|nr:unnamed protein product [Mytilus edulis]
MVLFQKCEKSNKEAEDHKLNYNRGLLWRGLNDRIRRTAVRNGDGPAMIRFWKLDLVQFHITHHPKYFILAHRLIAGEYKISETIVDDRKIAMITPTHEDKHQSKNLIIMDDTDKILLEGIYFKRKCTRNALNIYSPAGFLLGTVKERYLKWSADYAILAAKPDGPFSCKA